MKCSHATEHLVGTAEGIKCRVCGKVFATFDELVKDRKEDTPKQEVKEAPTEETEAPKKKTTKKGAK